jgi:membrane protein DedA with SNARE-associated domain
MNTIIHLLNQYGYLLLFFSLMLELIIIPIPNEALMSYVGLLCFQGKMNVYFSIITAGAGGILGATISYWIGYKLGVPFFQKYGHYIHLGPEKMEKMSKWYEKYGKVLLIFSFFIPGIRHIASIISGVIKLPFRNFTIFAYLGVFLWVGTFITLGNLLGPQWDQYQGEIKKWLVLSSIFIGFVAIIYFVIRANRNFIKEALYLLNEYALIKFKSFIKIKFIIVLFLILFILFFILMVGMIQDLIYNEFGHFNIITKKIVFSLFNIHWQGIMDSVYLLSSWTALGLVSVFTLVLIYRNKENSRLEFIFFVSALIGTFLLSRGSRWLFSFMLNKNSISADFPNEQSMVVMSVYGFLLFMLIRHNKNYLLSVVNFLFFLLILFAYFISGIYIHDLKPNDLVAGYVFSAVWITGMSFSLEMFRLLYLIKKNKQTKKMF